MTTTANPITEFIRVAAKISGIEESIIMHPSQSHMTILGREKYYLACRLRWLACVYAREQGMGRMEIIRQTSWSESITYNAESAMSTMKQDKPLCRMLRAIMGELN